MRYCMGQQSFTPSYRGEPVKKTPKRKARYIIAIDSGGVYLRRTLCVIHREELGEAHYHTKPARANKAPKHIQIAFTSAWAAWRTTR